jgi:hypothetical protein
MTERAPEEPNKFLAVSFLTDAQQYRQASRILSDSQFDRITSPQYFLMSQSIELYLKAPSSLRPGVNNRN